MISCIQSLVLEKILFSPSCLAEVFTIPSQRMGRRKFEILQALALVPLWVATLAGVSKLAVKVMISNIICFLLLVLFLSRSQ